MPTHRLFPFFLLFGLLLCTSVRAQQGTFPVSATLQTLPPFQPNISEWANPLTDRLGLTLLLNDRQEPGYQVQLRLRIEGQGVRLVSRPEFRPTPIGLSFGQPVRLSAMDLREYFDLDHLSFSGISREQYLAQGGLPPGTYSICFEAIDLVRLTDEPASLPACSFVQARLLDPPAMIAPTGQQTAIFPQQLFFQWQARHTASFMTRYTLQVFEDLREEGFTPEQVFSLQQPFLESTVTGITSLNVDASFPQLEPGKSYFARVKAEDPMGAAAFKNDGFSELIFFSFGAGCTAPEGLTADVRGPQSARVQWAFTPGTSSYVMRFRAQSPTANWYEEATYLNRVDLEGLSDSTTYEVQVQSLCGNQAGAFGPVYTFTTDALPTQQVDADCGTDIAELPRPTNRTPITELGYGITVKVGQFDMKVTAASPADGGSWDGAGQVFVPWMQQRINCTFKRLFVNENREVYDGNVIAVDKGLESLDGFQTVAQVMEGIDAGPLNFCGDSITSSVPSGATAFDDSDVYADHNPTFENVFVPYDPANPTRNANDAYFYDPYNPANRNRPYVATDYSNPNNPYTEEQPFDASNIWNPYNSFNPYDPLDYDDPANPWSASFPYSAERMFEKQAITSGATSNYVFSRGIDLPFQLGSSPNMIAIYGMRFTPNGAYLNAYATAKVPTTSDGADRFMAFRSIGLGFQPGGLQGESKMNMLADQTFTWNNKARMTLKRGSNTYVKFDCGGLTEVGLEMTFEFCRDVVTPIDPITWEAQDDAYVTGTFIGKAAGFDEFTGDVSITPFELSKLPGWAFTIENAVFDLSDKQTPISVKFPRNYDHPEVDQVLRDGRNSPGWKGFYLGLAQVKVPESFTTTANRDSTVITTIGARSLIIDQTGFTGDIFATNILTLEQGQIGSWAFSLDTVALGIQQNQFHHATLGGKVEIPVMEQALAYGAHIQPGSEYKFNVRLTDTLSMSAFRAKVDLYKNTEIGISYRKWDDQFSGYAKLYGEASFSPSLGGDDGSGSNAGDKLNIPRITFEGFHLSTRAPYLENVGSWTLASNDNDQPSASGFPLTLNEVGMFQDQLGTQVGFGIDLTLNLVNSGDQGFGARGRAFIICDVNIDAVTKRQTWTFNRVRVDRLDIKYAGAGFKFAGFIEMFERDAVFGSGFSGGIQASFTPSISVAVVALFGKKDDYRYFFADAMVAFNPGITLGASGVAIYGFGGGVSYHMERIGFQGLTPPESEATGVGDDAAADADNVTGTVTGGAAGAVSALEAAFRGQDPNAAIPPAIPMPSELGQSLSGVRYIPNPEVGIGIKASIAFGAIKREVFNGDITFEIIFNTGGGLRYIGLAGNARFLTPPKTGTSDPKPSLACYLEMGYDFENEAFSAYLRLQISVLNGLIRGAYPNDVAGEGNIYADKDEWYIYLGTPEQRIKISFDPSALANIGDDDDPAAGSGGSGTTTPLDSNSLNNPLEQLRNIGLTFTTYMDAGTKLPAFPDPPAIIKNYLDEPETGWNPTNRDDPVFADAGGLLFGASVDISMPELHFLIFYAYLNAGVGFDMMLKDYGPSARCANMANSPQPIGLNGWYATGQFYAYLEAGVGLSLNFFGFNAKFPIFDVGAAALLRARLPNPLWMHGTLAGEYSILNGLIQGNCEFEFEAGTLCEIAPGSLESIELIESIEPMAESTEVDVFTNPQALFTLPVDQITVLQDDQQRFLDLKPQLESFRVTDPAGREIPGTLEWNTQRNVAAFRSTDILPGETELTVTVKANVLHRYGPNEPWTLLEVNGQRIEETKTTTFTTGVAPTTIVEENVRYAYPINRQLNYHRNESSSGYIQLDRGQDYLFIGGPGNLLEASRYVPRVLVYQNGQVVSSVPFSYNTSSNRLDFSLPGNQLSDGTISHYEVVYLPTQTASAVDVNIEEVQRDLAANLPDGVAADDNLTSVLVRSKQATGALTTDLETKLYRLDFRTSNYPTFATKVASLVDQFSLFLPQALTTVGEGVLLPDGSTLIGPYLSIDDFIKVAASPENLDVFELQGDSMGVKEIGQLVRLEAKLDETPDNWFNTHVGREVYQRFPIPSLDLRVRWPERPFGVGFPPVRATALRPNGFFPLRKLLDSDIAAGLYTPSNVPLQLRYKVPFVSYRDFADLYNQVGSRATSIAPGETDISPDLQAFLRWQYIYPPYGNYGAKLQYFLPGQTTPTSSIGVQIPYEVNIQKKK